MLDVLFMAILLLITTHEINSDYVKLSTILLEYILPY